MERDEDLEACSSSTVLANTILVYQVGGADCVQHYPLRAGLPQCQGLCSSALAGCRCWGAPHPKGLRFIPVNSAIIFLVPVSVPFGSGLMQS